MTSQRYLEDFSVGESFAGATRIVTNEDFFRFAELTGDDHPIHYDPDYAAQTHFGRPVAHGLLLMAWSAVGATALSSQLRAAMIALVEQGCRFTAPVFVGDRITPHFRVANVDKPQGCSYGHVRFAVEMQKEGGKVCFTGFHLYRVRRRSAH